MSASNEPTRHSTRLLAPARQGFSARCARFAQQSKKRLQKLPVGRARRLPVARPWLFARRVLGRRRRRRQDRQRFARGAFDGADAVGRPLVGPLKPVRLRIAALMDLLETLWLDPHLVALEESEHARLAGLLAS